MGRVEAAVPYDISLIVEETVESAVDQVWLRHVAARLLDLLPSPADLEIVVADDDVIAQLNQEYLGEEGTTDVLSFSARDLEADKDDFIWPPGMVAPLGEVILCLPQAQRQAVEHDHSLEAELAHLLVHGVLHLLGYDHAEPEEERTMRALEEGYLAEIMPGSHLVHG